MQKQEMKQVIETLMNKVSFAENNRLLYVQLCSLCGEGKPYEEVWYIAKTFWSMTTQNIFVRIIWELMQLYDEHKQAYGLLKLMRVCEQNQRLFYDNIADPIKRQNEMRKLLADIYQEYSKIEQQRKKLKTIRDVDMAHLDAKYILNTNAVYMEENFVWKDIEELIRSAFVICNSISLALTDECYHGVFNKISDMALLICAARNGNQPIQDEEREILLANIVPTDKS